MAKVALLPKSKQDARTSISSFMFQNITFVAGESAQEVSAQVGIMYMTDPNMSVEFTESDFKDLDGELLERMGKKLDVEPRAVKSKVLPKKTVAAKVKSTLSGVKPKTAPVEELVEEPVMEETTEEISSDE